MPSSASTLLRRFSARCIQPIHGSKDSKEMAVTLPVSISYPMGTILGEVIGTNEVQTVTLGAGNTGGTFTLTFAGSTTGAIAFNATAATVQAALVAIATLSGNAIQTLTLNGAPTGGFFSIAFRGKMTDPIAYNATAAVVQTALEGVAGTGNFTVSGSAGGPYTVTAAGFLAGLPIPALEAFYGNLLPSTASATFAVVNPGGGGSENVTVTGSAGGPYTVTFQDSFGGTNVAAMTGTGSLTGGANTVTIATSTAGVAGTAKSMKKWSSTATDGSQTAKAILKYDCQTDASGNIIMGQNAVGGEHGETWDNTPAWFRGDFDLNDLVDATATNIAQLGKIIQGSQTAGGILRIT